MFADAISANLGSASTAIMTALDAEGGKFSLEIEANAAGGTLWFSGQTVEFTYPWADEQRYPERLMFSDLIFVSEKVRGTGLTRRLLANSYCLALNIGLHSLALKASWIGAYSWLRYGFVPTQYDWETSLKPHLTNRLLLVQRAISVPTFQKILRLLGSDDPKSAWIIADDLSPIRHPLVPGLKLGQVLLVDCGAAWYAG